MPERGSLGKFALVLLGLVTLSYPLAIYAALGRVELHWLALLLVVPPAARGWVTRDARWLMAAGGAALLGLASVVSRDVLHLKLYPVLVNALLLAFFGASLLRGPSMVERLARLKEPELPQAAVAYTRRVTQVWCGFFVLNGTLAAATALWATDAVWALYNGLVAYGLMGALFAGEWLVRRRVQERIALQSAHG